MIDGWLSFYIYEEHVCSTLNNLSYLIPSGSFHLTLVMPCVCVKNASNFGRSQNVILFHHRELLVAWRLKSSTQTSTAVQIN